MRFEFHGRMRGTARLLPRCKSHICLRVTFGGTQSAAQLFLLSACELDSEIVPCGLASLACKPSQCSSMVLSYRVGHVLHIFGLALVSCPLRRLYEQRGGSWQGEDMHVHRRVWTRPHNGLSRTQERCRRRHCRRSHDGHLRTCSACRDEAHRHMLLLSYFARRVSFPLLLFVSRWTAVRSVRYATQIANSASTLCRVK